MLSSLRFPIPSLRSGAGLIPWHLALRSRTPEVEPFMITLALAPWCNSRRSGSCQSGVSQLPARNGNQGCCWARALPAPRIEFLSHASSGSLRQGAVMEIQSWEWRNVVFITHYTAVLCFVSAWKAFPNGKCHKIPESQTVPNRLKGP